MINIPTLRINAVGDLEISAGPSSAKTDFDFYVGNWKVHNKKLKTRLNQCTEWLEFDAVQDMRLVLNGLGNIDHFHTNLNGTAFEGMTVRLFNPNTKLWSIYWADSNAASFDPPVVGSFDKQIGHFFTKDVFNGKNIIVVFRWDARDPDNPVWSQAFSEDKGQSWEWNWYMYMSKIA